MRTFTKIGPIDYHPNQRSLFTKGLRKSWGKQYPYLFDEDDRRRWKRGQAAVYFFEWLAAILLHHSTGYRALVTKYQYDARKRRVLKKILRKDPKVLTVLDDRKRWRRKQGPDLLMYSPQGDGWFFCEAKGPTDKLRPGQKRLFRALAKASGKPISLFEFRDATARRRSHR